MKPIKCSIVIVEDETGAPVNLEGALDDLVAIILYVLAQESKPNESPDTNDSMQ